MFFRSMGIFLHVIFFRFVPIWALRTTTLEIESIEARAGCKSCGLVHLDKTLSLSWSMFPPSPIPGYSISFYCSPKASVSWDESPVVDAVLEEGCGFDSDDQDLSSNDENCKQQAARTNKRASYLGVPTAFVRQMVVCGRCTVCTAFQKVKSLWKKIKAAVKKVVDRLASVKRSLFGYSYAPSSVRNEMQERFDGFFPEESHTERLHQAPAHANESLLQKDDHDDQDDHEITEKKLRKHSRITFVTSRRALYNITCPYCNGSWKT